jgi:hypothetical protein
VLPRLATWKIFLSIFHVASLGGFLASMLALADTSLCRGIYVVLPYVCGLGQQEFRWDFEGYISLFIFDLNCRTGIDLGKPLV